MRNLYLLRCKSYEGLDDEHKDKILEAGEPLYCIKEKLLFIGDGVTSLHDLSPISSLVAADNGRLYSVKIDNDGNVYETIPITITERLKRTVFEKKFDVYAFDSENDEIIYKK